MKEKNKETPRKFLHLLFDHALIKFISLVILHLILLNTSKYFPDNIAVRWLLFLPGVLIVVYFIILVVHVIRESYSRLMNPKNLLSLIGAYALLILALITIFSMLYNFTELSSLGYLSYGNCSSTFQASQTIDNPLVSRDYFYFASVTFFTVGYGDICPMGFAKYLSVIVAFVGHLVSVILVALVIHNYLNKKNK